MSSASFSMSAAALGFSRSRRAIFCCSGEREEPARRLVPCRPSQDRPHREWRAPFDGLNAGCLGLRGQNLSQTAGRVVFAKCGRESQRTRSRSPRLMMRSTWASRSAFRSFTSVTAPWAV